MALPDSYTFKPGSIPAYFDAILDAEAPERFSIRFLEAVSKLLRKLEKLGKNPGFETASREPGVHKHQ